MSNSNPWSLHGHNGAVEALRRVIRDGTLAHAYLISGPDGVGKGALATRLAQVLVSPSADDPTVPDLTTRAARQIEAHELADIERIAIGGVCDESNHDHVKDNSTRIRICQVRRIERVASLAPFAAPRRIFVVDNANQLQPEAAHALLKTLEEPAAGVLLILLATDPDDLLPTIRSRCQELPLRPMSRADLLAALEATEGVADTADLDALARLAHGRYGLAMRMHADPTLAVLRESATAEAARLATATRNERFDVAERLGAAWYRDRDTVLQTLDLWRDWWRDALLAAAGVHTPAPSHLAGEGGGGSAHTESPLPREATADTRTSPPPTLTPSPLIGEGGGGGDRDAQGRTQSGPKAMTVANATRALVAIQTAREHLLANTHAQLAMEVLMLDLPVLEPGQEAREPAAAR